MRQLHRGRLLYHFVLFTIFTAVFLAESSTEKSRTVRVGVYQNPPKVEVRDNKPQGIFIDLLEYIASREQWKLVYVEGSWNDGLRRLTSDSIDIMPDMGYSDTRNQIFDFNQIPVLPSWIQMYSKKGLKIKNISDLNTRRISIVEGSIQQELVDRMISNFCIKNALVLSPDHHRAIEKVKSGEADVVMVDRFYGYRKDSDKSIEPSPIVLNFNTLHFATAKGLNHNLLSAIDKHLSDLLNDPRSIYYSTLIKWLNEKPETFIPGILLWLLAIVSGLLVIFFALSFILKWQVNKRTEELDRKNAELSTALQKLSKAMDAAIKRERLHSLGQLASGIAHDFNNVLVPIIGYTDMLLSDTNDTAEGRDTAQKLCIINKAAMHGAGIVNRIQQFYQTTRQSHVKSQINIKEIIKDVIQLANPRFEEQNTNSKINVVLSLEDDTETFGVKSDIHEMILNLVLNAADAMPSGGNLEISARKMGGHIEIIVKDNGSGMSKEVYTHCMQPFFTTKGAKGTGIGLTMVNSTVINHNGTIEIESAPGVGTTFKIILPISIGVSTDS